MDTALNSDITKISTEELIQQIILFNQEGKRFCFILGAGASVESGYPSGVELEAMWMNLLMGTKADPYDSAAQLGSPEQTAKLANQLESENKIAYPFDKIQQSWEQLQKDKVNIPSKYFLDIFKLRFYPELYHGRVYFEKIMNQCIPSKGYHALSLMLTDSACLNNLVITTNFDELLEDILSKYEIKHQVVSQESISQFDIDNIQLPTICKVNRKLYYELTNIQEVKDYLSDEWKIVLNQIFSKYIPIVIGCGGGDTSLMSFLGEDDTIMENGIFWCSRNPDKITDTIILELMKKKHGKFVQIKGFDDLLLEIGNNL